MDFPKRSQLESTNSTGEVGEELVTDHKKSPEVDCSSSRRTYRWHAWLQLQEIARRSPHRIAGLIPCALNQLQARQM